MSEEIAIKENRLNDILFHIYLRINYPARISLLITKSIRRIIPLHPLIRKEERFHRADNVKLLIRKRNLLWCDRLLKMAHKLLAADIKRLANINNTLTHTLYSFGNQLLIIRSDTTNQCFDIGIIHQRAMKYRAKFILQIRISRKFLSLKKKIISAGQLHIQIQFFKSIRHLRQRRMKNLITTFRATQKGEHKAPLIGIYSATPTMTTINFYTNIIHILHIYLSLNQLMSSTNNSREDIPNKKELLIPPLG